MEAMALINPIAFHLGPLAVHWYGVIITGAIGLGIWLAAREAARLGMDPDFLIDLATWAVPAAIVGARLYQVFILEWPYFRAHPGEIPAIWEGGLAIHGAVLAGALVGYIFVRRRRASFWRWADIIAPSLILGQAIGRWGNFINQEAYGTVAPDWVIRLLPGFIREQMWIEGAYRHPTFLYESLWNLAVFALLVWLRRRHPRQGIIFMTYVGLYSVGRLLIEGIRTDSTFTAGGLRVAQIVSAALIVVAMVAVAWIQRHVRERYGEYP